MKFRLDVDQTSLERSCKIKLGLKKVWAKFRLDLEFVWAIAW